MSDRWTIGGLVVCVAVVGLCGLGNALACGERLEQTRYAWFDSWDAYSEAGVVRAGDGFAARGFWATYGLPNTGHGPRFRDLGLTGPSGALAGESIYHGDPPGTYWVTGIAFSLGGGGQIVRARLVPILLGVIAVGAFAWTLARVMGPTRALIVLVLSLATPMFTNMVHGLYYHGYALSLLLLQIAVLAPWFATPRPIGMASRLAALGGLGFAQGWLSYTYCGVVALAAIPIALLFTPPDQPIAWKRVWACVAVSGGGFVMAHALHFGQSVLYFGDLGLAFDEYLYRSNKTYWLNDGEMAQSLRWQVRLVGLRDMIEAYARWTHLGGPMAIVIVVAALAAIVLERVTARVPPHWRLHVSSAVTARQVIGSLAALLAANVWVILKPHHAIAHMSVTARTMILFHLYCALLLASALEVHLGPSESAWGAFRPGRSLSGKREGHDGGPVLVA